MSDCFELIRVERAADAPGPAADAIDVALLDMNHGYPNVGHDAIVAIVRDRALALEEALGRAGRRVRLLSYAVRDRMMVPDHAEGRHRLYVGTGGPGHLDPRQNTAERGTAEILEDPAWEAPLWRLFDAVLADESSALFGVCHTFGLLCRWSHIARPVLRGADKGGARSGIGTNLLTPGAVAHPWFEALAGERPDGVHVPVLDSRFYDLIPEPAPLPAGMTAIAYEDDGHGGRGEGITMLEVARERGGAAPRVFAVNSHPEIGAADRVEGLLHDMLARGSITTEVFVQRSKLLPVLRDDRSARRLRVARRVFDELIGRRLERLVSAA